VSNPEPCPIAPAVDVLFGRWTASVLRALTSHGRLRFGELRAHMPAITSKVLSQRLRQLERDGLVVRTYHREMPPRVEYEATELGRTLAPVFDRIAVWAENHLDEVRSARTRYDRTESSAGAGGSVPE
jgi:DNA-binding HxlR family transcriptional regulator